VFLPISVSLENFYRIERQFDAAQSKNDVTDPQFGRTILAFTLLSRNIPTARFVYTGAAA
jgi:hypothetical protein